MRRSALLILPLLCAPIATLWALPEREASADWTKLQDDEHTPLQEAMETLKKGQRGLKKLVGDPGANQKALMELLEPMEEATLLAVRAELPLPDEIEVGQRPLLRVGYKVRMAGLLQQVLVMQEATLKQDSATLQAAYKQLGQLKKSGHKDFRDF